MGIFSFLFILLLLIRSEEDAKKSIYSVSTKYYYAFGCKVPEDLVFKIKSESFFPLQIRSFSSL